MKLFLFTLITSTICQKATIWEQKGSDKNVQSEFGKCIYVSGRTIGIKAPKGVEVRFYKGNACQKHYFLWAYGTVKFDKAYDYGSVKLANRDDSENNKALRASDDSFGVSGDN